MRVLSELIKQGIEVKNNITISLSLLFLAVTGTIVMAISRPAFADDPTRPFMATFSGTALFTSQISAEFHGSGEAMHLGETTNSGFLYPLIPETTDECEAGWGIPHTNTETLTAADGDQLVLVMNDLACPVGPNVFAGTGIWHVGSGTGRFANASGWGTAIGGGDFNTGMFQFTVTGQISY